MEYPVSLNIEGRLCVVVGGGPVALRKVRGLAGAGAKVRLVAPCLSDAEGPPPGVECLNREYRCGDLKGAFLAFAATDDRSVNAAVTREARRAGVPVNVADSPREGNFSLPARLFRDDLCVTVSTHGKSPAFAVLVRDYLDSLLGAEWAIFLRIAEALRQRKDSETAGMLLRKLMDGNLPGLIRDGREEAAEALLEEVLGSGFPLAELGIDGFAADK